MMAFLIPDAPLSTDHISYLSSTFFIQKPVFSFRHYCTNIDKKDRTIATDFAWNKSPNKVQNKSTLKPLFFDIIINISNLSRINLVQEAKLFLSQFNERFDATKYSRGILRIYIIQTTPTIKSFNIDKKDFDNFKSFIEQLMPFLSTHESKNLFIRTQHPEIFKKLESLGHFITHYTKNIQPNDSILANVSVDQLKSYLSTLFKDLNVELKMRPYNRSVIVGDSALYCNISKAELTKFKESKLSKPKK